MNFKTVFILGGLLLLCSCAPLVKEDKPYVLPQHTDVVTYEIEQKDGYPLQTFVVGEENVSEDPLTTWEQWNIKREADAKYQMYQKLHDSETADTFADSEELRIEAYCESYGFSLCKKIQSTCDKDGCYKVEIACASSSFDPVVDKDEECRTFDVTVSEDIDADLTQQSDDEVLSGGRC
jgi:hypothetical protein